MGFGKEAGRSRISFGQDCHGDGLQADFFDFLFSEQQVMPPALTIFEPLLGKTNKVTMVSEDPSKGGYIITINICYIEKCDIRKYKVKWHNIT